MSEIALYNALTKLGLEHDAAKEAVADVASNKNVATKTDIAELKGDIREIRAELKHLRWLIVIVVGCRRNNQIFIRKWQQRQT